MFIRQIFISAGHSSTGPADFPLIQLVKIDCAAGRGLIGDRCFDFRENYKDRSHFSLRKFLNGFARSSGFRANRLAACAATNRSDVDLNSRIGREFEISGVRLGRASHCAPCCWMDTIFAPGAKNSWRTTVAARTDFVQWLDEDRRRAIDCLASQLVNPCGLTPSTSRSSCRLRSRYYLFAGAVAIGLWAVLDAPQPVAESDAIGGMFMSIFERQFGNSRFVELA